MDNVEYIWAAGFIEGDGCFALSRCSGNVHETTRSPVVHVAQVELGPLYRLATIFGGSVRPMRVTAAGNQAHQWITTGREVIPIIEAVLPYIISGVKKMQAISVLAYANTIGSRGRGRLSPLAIARRRVIIQQFERAKL